MVPGAPTVAMFPSMCTEAPALASVSAGAGAGVGAGEAGTTLGTLAGAGVGAGEAGITLGGVMAATILHPTMATATTTATTMAMPTIADVAIRTITQLDLQHAEGPTPRRQGALTRVPNWTEG